MQYEIPAEPKAKKLWTTHSETGDPVEWRRSERTQGVMWVSSTLGPPDCYWSELLALGPVTDVHPDLAGLPAAPWSLDEPEDAWGVAVVRDANGAEINLAATPLRRAIVALINDRVGD